MLFDYDANKIIADIARLEIEVLKKCELYAYRVKIGHVDTEVLSKEISNLITEMQNKTRFLCKDPKFNN